MLRSLLITFLLLFSLPSYAAEAEDAKQFIDSVGKQVIAVVNGQEAEAQKQQHLQQLFTSNVDLEWMAHFVLGPAWQKATPEQQQNYLQAYRDYMLKRYTTNFADYGGSKYKITGVKDAGNGQYTVGMDVNAPNASEQEVKAGYRVRADNGQYKIVDIIIEGVSLINTQRSDFNSAVQQGGIDKVIEQLKSKS